MDTELKKISIAKVAIEILFLVTIVEIHDGHIYIYFLPLRLI